MVKVTPTTHFNSHFLHEPFPDFSPLWLPGLWFCSHKDQRVLCSFTVGFICSGYVPHQVQLQQWESALKKSKVQPIVLLQLLTEPNPHQTQMFIKFLNWNNMKQCVG